ncbi:MAG: acyl-CoA dehydrogenase [Deltaproteobacteria bacterium HGW-Deltaproteobacteria-12]|jgi:alkylation response protein AidB-like acyl-CoA dehydrogenase|nr:MAG: acyl-CoA dehydrogenase [Deltaproteobacteria bacterium HGW-Deltaproteobacteria-12]
MGQNFFKRDDRDVQFVLKEQLNVAQLLECDAYKDFTTEDFDMILSQAMKIAANDVAPTFQDGDREGCHFEKGKVTVPKSFHQAWKVYKEGSWFGLGLNPEYGGQGAPVLITEVAMEFFQSANFPFMCFTGMGPGNGGMIENYGTQKLKDLFVQKMYDGTWGGGMCLTEPAVGSDAHMVSAKAIPDGEYYRISGTKIFITSGEHDLTENIIHLVIARIEGAPPGAKGVSLFVVPKIRVNDDGSLGEPNDVACIGIEHKMGLNGSATCAMNFGENGNCRGYLVGEPGMGLAYMFQMVNLARMAVGLESVAFASNIYANCLAYAKERIQGTPYGTKDGRRVRIVEHTDIRRMLMNIKALAEGMRALVYKAYLMEDFSKAHSDPEERKKAHERLELFTPLVKAYCSDRIYEIGRDGIQILGGYGFTKEYPIEQYARDCKILSIWDGTNYVQAVDLIGRKLKMSGGRAFQGWVDEVTEFIASTGQANDTLKEEMALLSEALQAVLGVVAKYDAYKKEGRIDLVPLTATRFLDCVAEVAVAHLLLEQAVIAQRKLASPANEGDKSFYEGKLETVRYYVKNFLPQVFGRVRIISLEDTSAVLIKEESL